MRVELQTKTGDLVTRTQVPDFTTGAPKILFWGSRVFLHWGTEPPKVHIYREEFAAAVLDLEPHKEWEHAK